MNLAGRLYGILDQKRALEQNLAACAAPRAFALTPPKQLLIFLLIDIRPDKTADLARRLPRTKLESR
jgi:hypothetical protein